MIELSSVAKAALGQLLSAVGTQAREWFKKTAFERAADRLIGTHPHGQDLKRALPGWLTSPQLRTALFKIQQGGGEADRQALANALICWLHIRIIAPPFQFLLISWNPRAAGSRRR